MVRKRRNSRKLVFASMPHGQSVPSGVLHILLSGVGMIGSPSFSGVLISAFSRLVPPAPRWGPEPGYSLCAVSSIGVMREGPLHAAIKAILAQPGDRLEVPAGRFVMDLVRADGELVEVRTGGFGGLGKKLDQLLDEHRVRIVHPVAAERRIVRGDEDGSRTSPPKPPRVPPRRTDDART